MAGEKPKFNFGAPSSTSSSAGQPSFGAGQPSTGGLFGSAGTGSAFKASGFTGFGAPAKPETDASKSATGGAVGATPGTTAPGLFGAPNAFAASGLFGTPASSQTPPKPQIGATTSSSAGEAKPLFGGMSTGNAVTSPATGPTVSGSMFSKPSTTPAGNPPVDLFGSTASQRTPFASTDKANNPSTTASAFKLAPTGGSLFGGDKATPSTSTALPSFGTFGQTSSANPPNPAPPVWAPAPKAADQSTPATSAITQAPNSEADRQKLSLGNLMSQPTTTAPQSGFMGMISSSQAPTPASSATALPAPTASSAAPTSSLFGSLGSKPTLSAPGASTSLFGSLPQTSTTSTSQPPSNSLSTTKPTPAAPAPAVDSTKASFFPSASLSGPQPPPQSRLKNKTMDEILTRWASDLTKYTKEFQGHAETVANWDQILVDNMSKITKLYSSAVTAEKQTSSIEMQLSAVEHQQDELEAWLDKYEGHVDEMLGKDDAGSGQEDGIGGPDTEREKTYKMAEKLGERLEEMGRDLGVMVEEINAANTALSGVTKDGEPITQIVRILNSHLSQLQAIDQGTVVLQDKVSAAMKSFQTKESRGLNGNAGSGGAVEDFYRSYLGKRP